MIASLQFASFVLLLSGCSGALFGLIRDTSNFDIDQYNYIGDPLGVSCLYDENQVGFHQEKFNGSTEIPSNLSDGLNNGKSLSLYFDGIATHLTPSGATFKFAKEWFKASNSNICYMTYAFEKIPDGIVETFSHARKMVKTHRLQFSAKLARDLVLSVRQKCIQNEFDGCLKEMSRVNMLGFSFGAHIASQACRDVFKATDQKVGKLIGVDPAGIWTTLQRYNQAFIRRGDAQYVQIIHTDILAGTTMYTGDVDILVEAPVNYLRKHHFSVYMHMATSMKKLLLIAERNGIGRIVQINSESPETVLRDDEVIVGVHSEPDERKYGLYKMSVKDSRTEILRSSIAHVIRAQM